MCQLGSGMEPTITASTSAPGSDLGKEELCWEPPAGGDPLLLGPRSRGLVSICLRTESSSALALLEFLCPGDPLNTLAADPCWSGLCHKGLSLSLGSPSNPSNLLSRPLGTREGQQRKEKTWHLQRAEGGEMWPGGQPAWAGDRRQLALGCVPLALTSTE